MNFFPFGTTRRVSRGKISRKPYNKPSLTKLVRSKWRDIGLVLLWTSTSAHKHAEKDLSQYPAILTSRVVNNPYVIEVNSNQRD